MSPSRILVVEDHEAFRRFIRVSLQPRLDFQFVGEALDGLDAVQQAQELQPNLVLLDIGLPKLNGFEAAQQIRRLAPQAKLLFISQMSSADVVREAFRLGASGYVRKSQAHCDLLPAVDAVLRGERFVSSGLEFSGDTTVADLTELEEADEIRLRYAAIVESSDDAIIAKTLQGVISAWNPAAQRMFGFTQEEALGQPITIIIPSDLYAEEEDILRKLRVGERIEHSETRRISKAGKAIDVSLTVSPIKDAKGRIIGSSTIARDITESKKALADLRENEERFRLAAQAGKMYAFKWNALTNVIVRSGNPAQIVGGDGLINASSQQVWEQVHPDDRERLKAAVAKLTPEEPQLRISHRMIRQDGEVIYVERHCRAHFDEGRRMVGFVGMVADVTERKLAEAKLQEYERAVEGAEEMIMVVDREYRYLIANNTFLKMRNMLKEQVVGRPASEVLNKGVFEAVIKEKLDECFQGKVIKYEMKYTYPEIGERDLFISYFPIEGPHGVDRVACIAQDITERKRAERALCESEQQFRLAAQAGKMYSFEWDVTTGVVVRSPERFKVLGDTEPLRFTHQQFLDSIHADDRAKVIATIAKRTPENPTAEVIYRVRGSDGALVWLKSSGHAFFNPEGKMLRVIGMVADITDLKRAEEALSEVTGKLINAQERERSRLARDLHDDISQRLALLSAQLDTLKPEEARKQIEDLGSDIQALSHRLHSPRLDYLGLTSAAAAFCKEVSKRQQVKIDFQSEDLSKDIPSEISLSLYRVLQEALQNAIKHSGSRQFQVSLHGGANAVELTVRDSGVGFDVVEALKGSGLGLTSMQERLRLVDGQLSIDSKPQRGTTIHALVPLAFQTR